MIEPSISRPFGTGSFDICKPSVESPGYFRSSLRDFGVCRVSALVLLIAAFAAGSFAAEANDDLFPVAKSKKGLQVQMVEDAIGLGVQHAALNWNLAQMIDLSKHTNSLRHGDYFFKRGYIEGMDRQVKELSQAGAVVSLILLYYKSGNAEMDRVMLHPKYSEESPNRLTAFNTSNDESAGQLRACFEFIAKRYSERSYPHGRVANYIVGNEVN